MLQLLDDLLILSERSGITSQGITKQVTESFQNSYTTSESILTLSAPISHNGQTHSNNSSAIC